MNSIKTIGVEKVSGHFTSIESLVNQAVKNHKEGNLELAITLYLELIELDSKQPAWIYGNAITLLAKVERYEQGLLLGEKTLEIYQKSDEVYRAIGLAYYKKNDLENCIKFYRKAIELYDCQPDWLYVGLLEKLIESDRSKEGLELGNVATQKYPDCQWLYFFLGRLYETRGELDSAIENYEKANIESEVNQAKINRLKTIVKETKEFQDKNEEININDLETIDRLHKHQQLFVLKTYEEDVSGLGIVARRCLELGNAVSDARGVSGKVLIAGRPDTCQNFVNKNNYNYLWTTFESSKIPDTWVNSINKYYSEVFVPHSYVKQAFVESGVEVPVSIVPQSYFQRNRTKPIERQKPRLKLGVLGVPNHRKNIEQLVQAVALLDRENYQVELSIHCPWLLDNTQEVWNNYQNISLTVGVKSDDEIDDWYSSLDAYIYPSSGEGWSFTPRESMSLGIPTIITDIPVHQELVQSGFYLPVSSNEWKPADYEFLESPCGEWKNYSVEQIKNSIIQLIQEYDYWYDLAQTGQEWIKKTYQWKPVKKKLLAEMFPKHILFCPEECLTKSIDAYCDRLLATSPKTKYINSYKYLAYILEKEKIQSLDINCDLYFSGLGNILNLLEQFEGQKTLTLHSECKDKGWQPKPEIQKYLSIFDRIVVGDKRLSEKIPQAKYMNFQYKSISKQSIYFLPLPERQLLYTLLSDSKVLSKE